MQRLRIVARAMMFSATTASLATLSGWLCLHSVASVAAPDTTLLQPANLPTPVRAIKFDPWQSMAYRGPNLAPLAPVLLDQWAARGFNTVLLIVQPRGLPGDPSSADPCCCGTSGRFGGDLLGALLDAATSRNMTIVPGVWGLRNFPVGEAHPEWRAVNENGTAPVAVTDEGGDLCAASPYAERYLLPLVRHLRRSYGVRSFFLMEFWQPLSLDFPERTSYSPFMIRSFVGSGLQDREALRLAVRANNSLHDAWHRHQMEQQWNILVGVDEALRDGVVGAQASVLWHNVQGIDTVGDGAHTARSAWNFLRDHPTTGAFGAPVVDFVGNMLLYADVMCFDGLTPSTSPDDLPPTVPVQLAPAVRRQRYLTQQLSTLPVGAVPRVLTETIGRSIVSARPTAASDVVDIFLAGFVSAGRHSAGFIYEQDAWAMEPAPDGGGSDVWDGVAHWMRDLYQILFAATVVGDSAMSGLSVDNATLTAHRVLHAPLQAGSNLHTILVLANLALNRSSLWTVPASNETVLLDIRKGVVLSGRFVRVMPETVAVIGVSSTIPRQSARAPRKSRMQTLFGATIASRNVAMHVDRDH